MRIADGERPRQSFAETVSLLLLARLFARLDTCPHIGRAALLPIRVWMADEHGACDAQSVPVAVLHGLLGLGGHG